MPTNRELSLSELRVTRGRELRTQIRWELFVFRDVRDVLATADPDRLLVVHYGAARPQDWLEALWRSGLIIDVPIR